MKDKVSWTKIDQLMFDNINKSETSQFISNLLKTIRVDTFKTNEGAEGYFIRSSETKGVSNLFESQKRPLILVIHGGPHAYSPKDSFLKSRLLWLSMGYNL